MTYLNTIDCGLTPIQIPKMFKKIKDIYKQYKPYIRGDLLMYGFMILLVFIYIVYRLMRD